MMTICAIRLFHMSKRLREQQGLVEVEDDRDATLATQSVE